MKKFTISLGMLLVFLVSVSIAADSALVELAKKEKERRAKVKASKTFTNKDIEDFKAKNKAAGGTESSAAEEGTAESTESGEKTEGEGTTEKAEDLSNSEEYWRGRYQANQDRVKQAEEKMQNLQSDVNALNRLWYHGGADDQRRDIENERVKRLDEIETAKRELEEAKQAEENLQEEARQNAVPPGWVREE